MGDANIPCPHKGLIELNEAFAVRYIACERGIGFDWSLAKVDGSGCGLGHPAGVTGSRLVVTLLCEMARRGVEMGWPRYAQAAAWGLSD